MIHVKDHKQLGIFNPFAHLGAKRLALLESSWAHLFREEILHKPPVEKLFPFYDELQGRKSKELYPCNATYVRISSAANFFRRCDKYER